MLSNNRNWLKTIFCGLLWIGMTACATAASSDRVRHGFGLEVDQSLSEVRNIRYHYGDLKETRGIPVAAPPGVFTSQTLTMIVPDEFEISWETVDGKLHEAVVPVRGHLPSSVKNKLVVFVIMQNEVQGYLLRSTPYGDKRERFY